MRKETKRLNADFCCLKRAEAQQAYSKGGGKVFNVHPVSCSV